MKTILFEPDKAEPHIFRNGTFNHYAFNALAVSGLIAAFHAGERKIFVYKSNVPILEGSSPMNALKEGQWKFIEIPDNLLEI